MKTTWNVASLFSILLISFPLWAWDRAELGNLQQMSLHSLVRQQARTSDAIYLAGEWPSQVEITGWPNLLGLGKAHQRFEDPTAFVTASVVNLLHETFASQTPPTEVQELIARALPSFSQYFDQKTQSYFFFPQVQLPSGQNVHYPRVLRSPKILSGGFLIPPDADTTSVIFLALLQNSSFALPPAAIQTLVNYRDLDRNSHGYNKKYSDKNTGAFLTWLMPEEKRKKRLNFFPKGLREPRIPYGINDVDCVVNSNVLRLFSATQNFSTPGYTESCRWLNQNIAQAKYDSCGVYYPNSFYLHFAATNALKAGASCLQESAPTLVQHILSKQNPNGSWTNTAGLKDEYLTSLFAMSALINIYLGQEAVPSAVVASLQAGLEYLKSEIYFSNDSASFDEGVFFSAFPPLRNLANWRSKAYTLALALKVFTQLEKINDRKIE